MDSRVAVVTGANRGLGLITCQKLAEMGFRVVLTARSKKKGEEAADELKQLGLAVQSAELDVVSEESVDRFFVWLESALGRMDILINNAGTILERHGELVVGSTVLHSLDNNAVSAYRMLLRAVPMMNNAGYGRAVNVSSGMGQLSDMGSGLPAYRISKAALNAVTRIFHAETRGNVKVNSVCPGWVNTDMGGPGATRGLQSGVKGIVWAATLPDDGPSGGFFRDGESIPW